MNSIGKVGLVIVCLVLIGLVGGTGCSPAEKATIKIGSTQCLTGPIAPTEAILLSAMRYAVDDVNAKGGVNGQLLELVPVDNKGDPTKAVSDLNRMVDRDGVVAILSGPLSTCNIPEKKWAEDNQFPVFSSNCEAHAIRGSDWFTDFGLMDDSYVETTLKRLKNMGVNKLAILYTSLAFGLSGKQLVEEFAPKAGITIVATEVADPGMKDLTIQASKLKAANPDAIYAQCYQAEEQTLMMTLKAMNWNIPVIMNYSWIYMIGIKGDPALMEGVMCWHYEDMEKAQVREVWDKYQQWSGVREEHCFITLGWDMVQTLAAALKACGDDLSPKRVRDEYFKQRYPLVTGKVGKTTSLDLATKKNIQFDADDIFFYRFTSGKFAKMK